MILNPHIFEDLIESINYNIMNDVIKISIGIYSCTNF